MIRSLSGQSDQVKPAMLVHSRGRRLSGPLTLPDSDVLRALDEAHERGFRGYLSDIGHNKWNERHRRRASDALVELEDGLSGRGAGSRITAIHYTAAAYVVKYHLSHCILAYWAFKDLFSRYSVPRSLYVCDVGAGTSAGMIGLAIALSETSGASACLLHRC